MKTAARRSQGRKIWLAVAAAAALIGLWQLVSVLAAIPSTIVPTPFSAGVELFKLLSTAEYWQAVSDTLAGALLGLGAAILVGVPLGLLTGRNWVAEQSLRVPFEFGRAFPTIALLPALVLILGTNNVMKAVVVFMGVVFIVVIQSQQGARRLDPAVEETVRGFRIGSGLRVLKVVLPTAAPAIATGIQVATAAAIMLSVAVEVLAAVPGIGRQIALAQQQGAASVSFAFIITSGLLGIIFTAMVAFARRRLIPWVELQEAK